MTDEPNARHYRAFDQTGHPFKWIVRHLNSDCTAFQVPAEAINGVSACPYCGAELTLEETDGPA